MLYKSFKVLVILSLYFLIGLPKTYATELVISLEEAQREGFIPFNHQVTHQEASIHIVPHALSWPFEKPYSKGFLGNNFIQYQPYTPPGYHLGTDMVLERGSWLIAPVSGKLEAGGYAYTDLPNGSRIKHWKPWPQGGGASFELAIIDDQGIRYEFHHVDKESLSPLVISALNSSQPMISAGEPIGQVYKWGTPFHYDHVHVNVFGPNGEEYNPEYFFTLIEDTLSPEVKLYLHYRDNSTSTPSTQLNKEVIGFIISGGDKKNQSNFVQAPLYLAVEFESGGKTELDFRKTLTIDNGQFYDVRKLYPTKFKNPQGRWQSQMNDYYPLKATFHLSLPLPTDRGNGKYKVTVSDMAGNQTLFHGELKSH